MIDTPQPAATDLTPDLLRVMEMLPDAVLVMDLDWRIVYANATARRISRLPDGDLPEATHWQLYPQSVGTEIEAFYRMAMESRVSARREIFYAPFDVWLDVTLQPISQGLAIHYREITEAKRTEASRESALRQFHQVLEASTDSIVCIDRQWNCVYANSVAAVLLQGNPVGKNTWKDLPGNLEEPFYSNFWATMVQRTPTEFEAYYPEPLNIWFKIYTRAFDEGIIIFSRDITAAKLAEQAREATARRLQEVFDITSDGIVALDRNWNYTFLNRRAEELMPGKPNLLGKNFWEEFPGAIDHEVGRHHRRAMEEGIGADFETYYAEPLDRWYAISTRPSDNGIVLFFNDITERRRAEQTMRRQQELLNEVQRTARVATWEMDFATRTLSFGQGSYPVYGVPFSEIDSIDRFYAVIAPRHHDLILQKAGEAASTMQPVTLEFEAVPRPGESIWLEARAQAIAVDGVPRLLQGITFDISNRKRAEAAREAAARQLQQVFEVTSDAIFSLRRDWTVGFLNRCAEESMSRVKGLLGANFWRIYPELVGTEFERQYKRTLELGEPTEFEAYTPVSARWIKAETRATSEGMVVFFRDITEQRRSAEVLREQQELLAVVQRAARVATFNIDLSTQKITYGPGSFEVYGRPFAELASRGAFRVLRAARHNQAADQAVAVARRTMRPVTVEYEMPDSTGKLLWLESRFQAIAEDGVPRYLRGITIDITERKRNEAVLVASEARYRVLAELSPQGLWMTDPEGRVTYANQGFLDYLGMSVEYLAGPGWMAAVPASQQPQLLSAWQYSLTTGADLHVEVQLRQAADGAFRWWSLRGRAVRDDAGQILYWLGVGTDVDATRTAAEALKRQHEETERQRVELETVYETAPIGLALFDPVEFRYLRLNERQAQIVGLPKEKVLGRTLTEIAPIEELNDMFRQVAGGVPIRNQLLEGAVATSPNEHRYWTVNYFPVYGPDGKVQAITAASLEITGQKRAEAALIQSEKLAAVGRLASSISHEINNPLEAVTNLLYLIGMTQDMSPDMKTYVQMAQSELARVSQIATQTLRFHRQAVSRTSVVAAELIGAVLNLYQGRLANSSIKVEARYDSATRILCFENDIRQVLNNLIANAIDAMRNGGRLVVRAHDEVDREGRRGVRLTVADTGHGMSPQVLARVFEPFYTTKDLNGTGLGLWISEGIVQRHHGRLSVRSSEHPRHHGTVFSLFLPLDGSAEGQ